MFLSKLKPRLAGLQDRVLLGLAALLLSVAFVVGLIESQLLESIFPLFTLAAFTTATLLVVWLLMLRVLAGQQAVRESGRRDAQNTEALFSLYQLVQPRRPLPMMRGWAASPDFLKVMAGRILERGPCTIVECGSGTSSLVAGYLLEKLQTEHGGGGKLYSFEHETDYAKQSRTQLEQHGLAAFVEVLDAPLVTHQIDGKSWLWYDLSPLPDSVVIDILVIDGPPSVTQPHARYPALPLLEKYLSEHAVIILDDYIRAEDKEVVARWMARDSAWTLTELATEKGTAVLVR